VLHLALRGARISLSESRLRVEEGAMLERIVIFLKSCGCAARWGTCVPDVLLRTVDQEASPAEMSRERC
jgi:hypothetical protein